ncbi:MAG: MBL fold metallo-hydrolase RNA specificity domain-containing protein, partial [Alloprevotella sp.]|nr:MBL fold metallo-hydrolase RNA specificity domain-containing protein [Alloprevotella sp.]
PDTTSYTEAELQKAFEDALTQKIGHIVYLSSTNIDRLFSFYHTALRVGMPFIVDAYQKQLMDIVAKSDSLWSKSKLYQYGKYEPLALFRKGNDFAFNEKFIETIRNKGYVLIARANSRFDKLIQELPGEKKKYLSMWQGYLDERKDAYNAALAKVLEDGYEYLHTSGHCDMNSMDNLFRWLQPKAIIPIHTDNPDKFAERFSEEWPVIRLQDGQSIMPISSSSAESCGLEIFCTKKSEEGITREGREGGDAYGLDAKYIGSFKGLESAKFVMEHTFYRQANLVGYEIEAQEDLSPLKVHTFNANKNLIATYTHGGHQPGGAKYQEASRFAPSE